MRLRNRFIDKNRFCAWVTPVRTISAIAIFLVGAAWSAIEFGRSAPLAAEPAVDATTDRQPVPAAIGLTERIPLTTSRVIGSPDPPAPLRLTRIYPDLKFKKPLHIIKEPTTDRLLVTQQDGKILAFSPAEPTAEPRLFLDVGREAYSICFHPNYVENGYVYVFMNHPLPEGFDPAEAKALEAKKLHRLNRISRYTVRSPQPAAEEPPAANERPKSEPPSTKATSKDSENTNASKKPSAQKNEKPSPKPIPLATGPLPDPESELVLLEYPSFGHNGHYLEFGPDGMLWLSSGDGTQGMDINQDGQDTSNLRGNMLRIDVDDPDGDHPYSIPADNPYVGRKNIRPEIWAFGFRNPYRFAFDPHGSQLLVADIGQDAWEMIYHVEPAHNYGWSITEGSHPLNVTRKLGITPITPPIVEHAHSEMRSITGGPFYQGEQFPEYRGAYIYSDYETGRVWALRYDYQGRKVSFHQEIADSTYRIISIGEDATGELLLVSYTGELYRLARQPPPADPPPRFPHKLSETGLFASTAEHRVAAGVIPYSVNSPLWSDGAAKLRYMAVPGEETVKFTTRRAWRFPEGTVLIKTFSLPTPADASKLRRIETRLLTLQQGEWAGYSYIWNDQQTDATLLDRAGKDVVYSVADNDTPGEVRKQRWRFPGRVECGLCHTREARYVLGLTTLQMNRLHDYAGQVENQIAAFDRIGLFGDSLEKAETPIAELASLPNPLDEKTPLEERVRSYLHSNCAHCHVTSGGGNAKMQLEFTKTLTEMKIYDEPPVQTNFGIKNARLIAPGDADRSILLKRIGRRGNLQMPPVGTNVVDQQAMSLLIRWINQLPDRPAEEPAEAAHSESPAGK